jgi:hypothetical protein
VQVRLHDGGVGVRVAGWIGGAQKHVVTITAGL